MKILNLIIIFFLLSCSEKTTSDSNSSSDSSIEWTKNGTLHNKTIIDWKAATAENKLATCADFVVNIKTAENQKYTSITDMKYDAVNIKTCIDEAVEGNEYADNMNISEVAALCHIMMKSNSE